MAECFQEILFFFFLTPNHKNHIELDVMGIRGKKGEILWLIQVVTERDLLPGRMGETERSNAERPNQASCMPELQTVPLLENDDPSIIYYPTCTRVKRCGGCCTHPFLSCQPTATETRNFEVIHSHLIKCYRYICYSN